MGCYINPKTEGKESFLEREGTLVTKLLWKEKPVNSLPVVLINNGMFTSAGVAYSEEELKAFTCPDDFRKKKFYYVSIDKLAEVSDILAYTV